MCTLAHGYCRSKLFALPFASWVAAYACDAATAVPMSAIAATTNDIIDLWEVFEEKMG